MRRSLTVVSASAIFLFGALALTAPTAGAQTPDLNLKLVASGLDDPIKVLAPIGDTRRLFVLEQEGRVKIIDDGTLLPTPFLDLSAQVFVNPIKLNGMVGAAFHPDFLNNGWFYVYYSTFNQTTVLERYTVSATDPDVIDPSTAVTIYGPIPNPGPSFHMGGGPEFGPDGNIYIGIGDERTIAGTGCKAQSGDSIHGKLLRITDIGGIPGDNPFVGDPTVLDEIYAFGLRSPYGVHVDPITGDVFLADVGEGAWEEINYVAGDSGGGQNFGWSVVEGSDCTGAPSCAGVPCNVEDYDDPLHFYGHGHPCAVIGGGVYRGNGIAGMQGMYVLGDFCSGQVWGLREENGGLSEFRDFSGTLVPPPGHQLEKITGFGFDGVGEMYVVDGYSFEGPDMGEIYQLIRSPFNDLGEALEGTQGTPQLLAFGLLEPDTNLNLLLLDFLNDAQVYLLIGFTQVSTPFKGGVLVPSPDIVLQNLVTDGNGQIDLNVTWPAGVPADSEFFLQYWGQDPVSLTGWSASNALRMITP